MARGRKNPLRMRGASDKVAGGDCAVESSACVSCLADKLRSGGRLVDSAVGGQAAGEGLVAWERISRCDCVTASCHSSGSIVIACWLLRCPAGSRADGSPECGAPAQTSNEKSRKKKRKRRDARYAAP